MPGTQTTVGPSHEEVVASQPKNFEEWWQSSGLNRLFVKPVVDLLDYTGQVASGEVSPMGAEGHATPEALQATTNAAGLVPMSGLAGRTEEGLLAANAHFAEAKAVDPVEEELQKMLADLTDPNFSFGEAVPDTPVSMEQQPFHYPEEPLPPWTDEISMVPTQEKPIDLLAPKPLDTEKYPWLAKPETPSHQGGGILDRLDPAFSAVRNELYRRGMSQDQLNEIQQGLHSGTDEGLQRAGELSSSLRALLPEDWNYIDQRLSTVVPHAVDQYHMMPPEEKFNSYGMTNEDRLDVTNRNLNRRVDQLVSKADPEALSRAQEQGYNTDLPLYRGSRTPTDQFMDPSFKEDERGMFFADRPGITTGYGRYVYPVYTRAKDPYEVDFMGKEYGAKTEGPYSATGPYSTGDVHHHIERAREAGHDMAILRNLRDDDPSALSKRSTQDQYVIFDPSIIRSPLAKFDPERMNENNLLASQGVGINPFPWLQDQRKRK